MIIFFKKIMIILLVITFVFSLFLYHKSILKIIYPIKYKEIIKREAEKYSLDPYLVTAVIYVESKFKSEAVSNKGAKGLMQIMPKTGVWISEMLREDNFKVSDLYLPKVNIRYGCWYLGQLNKKFSNNLTTVLAAYNGGEGNVDKWLVDKRWDGTLANISQVPFSETRRYINKVLQMKQRYEYIYE